jgi:hypothetical protein
VRGPSAGPPDVLNGRSRRPTNGRDTTIWRSRERMTILRRFGWKAAAFGSGLVVVGLVAAANVGYYAGSSYSGNYCTTCHQIQASYDRWAQSVHRDMDCEEKVTRKR